jgi:hypothetical protein
MNEYQREQLEALNVVREGLSRLGASDRAHLKQQVDAYIQFRQAVDGFLKRHFGNFCTRACFQSQTSACCSKDGIITFFADTVIDALQATPMQLDRMAAALNRINKGHRCVYLDDDGCIWTVRPIVCAMFLCDRAMKAVFDAQPEAGKVWASLRQQEKLFKWPDRPVLFDDIEQLFMGMGYRSSLMHFNTSPGLLRVKKGAGLV